MVPLYVACIVEGQGDFNAAPVLLKRLVKFVNPDVYADVRPFRVTRSKLVLLVELERAVERAGRGLRSPGGVLIVIDSDDDCPKELAPALLDRATRAGGRLELSWQRGSSRVGLSLRLNPLPAIQACRRAFVPQRTRNPSATPKGGWRRLCLPVESTRRPSTSLPWRASLISISPGARRPSTKCVARSNVSVPSRLRFKVE